MAYTDTNKQIVSRIIENDVYGIISDLRQILDNHMVDNEAKKKLEELVRMIKFFDDTKQSEEVSIENKFRLSGMIDPTPEAVDHSIQFVATKYMKIMA